MHKVTVAVLALSLAVLGLSATQAHAQVVIQGQVTVGQDPYVQQQPQGYGQGNYVQQADPNAGYANTVYVAQPVGQPQPVRYIHRSSTIPALIVPGIVLLVGGYVTQAIGAPMIEGFSSDQLGFAYIPILGPWLQLGAYSDLDAAMEDGRGHFSWITGVAQALGLVLMVVGLTVREEWDEPVYALTDDPMGPTLAFDGSRATLTF